MRLPSQKAPGTSSRSSTRLPHGPFVILAVLADRCQETVKAFGFIHAAQEVLPQAWGVIDRFPGAKAYRGCAGALGKQELKRLKAELWAEE
jgi:hypothetical protein